MWMCMNTESPLKLLVYTENSLELEGDYSGGCHSGGMQISWMPIKGVSRIKNHNFKAKCRQAAIDIETLAIPISGSKDNTVVAMLDLVHMVMVLTNEVELNPINKLKQ